VSPAPQRNPAADDDGGYDVDGAGSDVDPALDLVRTMSMSSDKDILKQLRDAMNPRQKQQTIIMLVQAFMAMVAVLILLGVVIVGYISLRQVRTAVQTMADQTTELKEITLQTQQQMDLLVQNLAPVEVLPEFQQSLENMNEGVSELTTTLCASPLFSAQCPRDELPTTPATTPAPAPAGTPAEAPAEAPTPAEEEESSPDTIPANGTTTSG